MRKKSTTILRLYKKFVYLQCLHADVLLASGAEGRRDIYIEKRTCALFLTLRNLAVPQN